MSVSDHDFKRILDQYDARRMRASSERDERVREVYAAVPEVQQIDRRIESFGIRSMQQYLRTHEDPKALLRRMRSEIEELRARRIFLLKRAGFEPDYMELRYECDLCKDTGFVDGKRCRCLNQRLIEVAYASSNMASLLETENFSTFDPTVFSDTPTDGDVSPRDNILRICREIKEDLSHLSDGKPLNYLFAGTTGTGKTFLSSCIAKEVLDRGQTVLYISAYDFNGIMSQYRYRYRDADAASSVETLDFIYSCDLLIIDDIGTEAPNRTSAADLLHCVDERIRSGKSTLLSTNLNLQQLGRLYTDRLVSRIIGSYKPFKFIGPDLRLSHMQKA